MKKTGLLSCLLLLCACSGAREEAFYLSETAFSALPGWTRDDAAAALPALEKSCARIALKDPEAELGPGGFAGRAGAWQKVCAALPAVGEDAHAWFETHFTPYEVRGAKGREGLFTGYYVPLLRGSLEKKPPYEVPLYARPVDMLTADLGAFHPDLAGRSITGRVEGGKFVPYYKRAQIEAGALAHTPAVVWVDDAVDAFFLHIQGSGHVALEDGSVLGVGYAAQNGHAYTAIGRELVRRGALAKEDVSMQSIRAWLEAHPAEAADVMHVNESYVFFRPLEGEGVLGAQGVALTPGRSLAVDRRKIPYGVPLFVDAEHPDGEGRLQRLMIAQDTGGAIRGAVRGDYFWGAGEEAADKAGRMKSRGTMTALLPRGVEVQDGRKWRWWRAFAPSGLLKAVYNR